MLDIGGVSGVVQMRDEFSSKLNLVQSALSNFSKETQASLGAIGAAAGIVVAALTATAVAAVALGSRGADVMDASGALEHFAGSAKAADDIMAGLRAGTLETIADFDLAKTATKLLSVGVSATAEDFKTLGSSAFVLANRGLGTAKEMLDLVSDAMVTGKTRALAMKLGVIEAGDAEQDYADKLGIHVSLLSDAAKAEAHRAEIMRILSAAVEDAGAQERDFGEQIDFVFASMQNMYDEVAKAVSISPVLAAGMEAVFKAVGDAFGPNQATLITIVVGWIEKAAIITVDIGIAAVETARIFNTAWKVVETVVLGVTTAVTGVATGILIAADAFNQLLASLPGASDETKALAAASADAVVQMKAMTSSLAEQAQAAADSIVKGNAFDATLDKVGGTLMTVRDAMLNATSATEADTIASQAASDAANTQAKAKGELAKAEKQWAIDKQAATKLAIASESELGALQDKTNAAIRQQEADRNVMRAEALERRRDQDMAAEQLRLEAGTISETQYQNNIAGIQFQFSRRREEFFRNQLAGHLADLKAAQAEEEGALSDKHKNGKISEEAHQEGLLEIRRKYAVKVDGVEEKARAATIQRLEDARDEQAAILQESGEHVMNFADTWRFVGSAIDAANIKVVDLSGKVVALSELLATERAIGEGKMYTVDEFGNRHVSKDQTIVGPEMKGRVNPITDKMAQDRAYLEAEIAKLTKLTAEYNQAPPQSFWAGNDPSGSGLRAAEKKVQDHLDAVKQLEYLQKLLSSPNVQNRDVWGNLINPASPQQPPARNAPPASSVAVGGSSAGASITNHFYVNGTAEEVARKIGDTIMNRVLLGRQVSIG